MIFNNNTSTSSVGKPSAKSILRNSFMPLISKLHSKSVNLIFVFLLIKNDLLLFGSFILPYNRRLVECVDLNIKRKERKALNSSLYSSTHRNARTIKLVSLRVRRIWSAFFVFIFSMYIDIFFILMYNVKWSSFEEHFCF